jgi:hypothetical protein
MRHKLLRAVAVLAALGASAAPAAQADSDEGPPPTVVDHCAYVITAPGTYVLGTNLTCGPLPGVDIEASNVRFKMNGHSINSQSFTPAPLGVGATTSDKYVLVQGPGTISGAPFQGVWFENVSYSAVVGVEATGNGTGIYQYNNNGATESHNVFAGNYAHTNAIRGILIRQGSATAVLFNRCASNNIGIAIGDGFAPVTGSYVYGNRCTANQFGIRNGNATSGVFTHNTATGNLVFDLFDEQASCDNNNWSNNTFTKANQSCIG